jgi:hypothetical protein
MSEELDDWTYDPQRDDPWLDEAVAEMDRGEWVTHEQVVREIEEILAEAIAAEAAREKAAG